MDRTVWHFVGEPDADMLTSSKQMNPSLDHNVRLRQAHSSTSRSPVTLLHKGCCSGPRFVSVGNCSNYITLNLQSVLVDLRQGCSTRRSRSTGRSPQHPKSIFICFWKIFFFGSSVNRFPSEPLESLVNEPTHWVAFPHFTRLYSITVQQVT
jgi:hypothetical protein